MVVSDVSERHEMGFEVRRLWMPSSGVESWTVIGPDRAPVAVVDDFLAWLTQIERSPNTVEAYARDLKAFWSFLARQQRLRDRFLFALLASTGMRIGQALNLRHEDVISWERRIEIVPRPGSRARARSKGGACGSVPVPGELIRLWSDYLHEEYGGLDSDFVFVNLWEGKRGRPLSYAAVDKLVGRTRQRVGFHFSAHMLRHTYATLAYRDGVALEVIGTVLTHRSPHSAHIYTHPTAADLRRALEERGVLDRVADLVA